jgi:hypothetical protein
VIRSLPEIVKKGPINRQRNQSRKIVGISLQQQAAGRLLTKKTSLDQRQVSYRGSKARDGLL